MSQEIQNDTHTYSCLECDGTSFTLTIIPNWHETLPIWVYSPGLECDECGFVILTSDHMNKLRLNTYKAEIDFYTKKLVEADDPDTRHELRESQRKFRALDSSLKKSTCAQEDNQHLS